MKFKFRGKEREVRLIKKSICEIHSCNRVAVYYVTFEDGLWAYLCPDHAPVKE